MSLAEMGRRYGFGCRVQIEPTFTSPATRENEALSKALDQAMSLVPPGEDRNIGRLIERDIVGVTVSNSLTAPYQTCTLELLPRTILTGPDRTWAEIIPPYSLIKVWMHRQSGDGSDSAATRKSEPVFIGLVDNARKSADYSSPMPRRQVTVTCRGLTALLTDHRWWFHHMMLEQAPPDLRDYFQTRPSDEEMRRDTSLRVGGYLAVDPNIYEAVAHPVDAVRGTYQFFVGDGDSQGFIRLAFNDGKLLGDRLQLQADIADFVDPAAALTRQHFPTEMPQSSCWEVMQHFVEPHVAELYSDTFEGEDGEPVTRLVVRKPPWAGEITYENGKPGVGFNVGGAVGPTRGQSLFDESRGNWKRSEQTVVVGGNDVLGTPELARGIESGVPIFTFYDVMPQMLTAAGNQQGDRMLRQEIPPLADEDPDSPSYIQRFGIQPLQMRTKYIPILQSDQSTNRASGDIVRHSLTYAVLLRTWMHRNPDFWHGSYQLKGMTGLRVGKRLVDADAGMEFYITGVVQRQSFDSQQPHYVTSVQVSRGWELR